MNTALLTKYSSRLHYCAIHHYVQLHAQALRVYVSGFAVHLLCLPSTVAANGAGAQAVSAAMVGLGIVHHLQSQGLIALIDEPMWRCVCLCVSTP
jgi:hypothetical protein